MLDIDSFFDVVAREVATALEEIDPETTDTRHWVVIQDPLGVKLSSLEGRKPPHELLDSFMEHGVEGAAYVTYVTGRPESVLVQVLVTAPRNSDVRQATVARDGGSVTLQPWEYTV